MQDCTVGDRIRLKRKEQQLSQEALAEKMHLTGAVISNYENNKVDIKMSVLRDLARHLGTTVSFLAEGIEELDSCDSYNGVSTNIEETALIRDSELQALIRIYSLIRTPRIRSAALEQMKILNGI